MPTTGAFAITLYRMDMTPTCYLTGRLRLAKKPPVTTFKLQSQPAAPEDAQLFSQGNVITPHPKSPLRANGSGKSPFAPMNRTWFRDTLLRRSCIFPALWLHSNSIFNRDIGMYFPILTTASKCCCQQFLMTVLVCGGQSATLTYFVVAIRAYNNCN